MSDGFILKHSGYHELLSHQRSVVVYDLTVAFCRDFFHKVDRTIDQMVQAARSEKQNIIEGSMAAGTSMETKIKLTNVARTSLKELMEYYRDFLRTKQEKARDKNSKKALYVRGLASWKIRQKKEKKEEEIGTKATDVTDEKMNTAPESHASHSSLVTYKAFRPFEDRPAEIRANIAICLIHQSNCLLDQQLRKLEQDFLAGGGLREQMYRARVDARKKQ